MNASLESEHLILRQWRDEDLAPFAELNADPRVMQHFPWILSREESDEMAARYRAHVDQHGFGFWAVELKGSSEFIGLVGLQYPRFEAHFTPCVEIGWRLAHAYWGNGYAPEAARAAIEFGFTELGLDEIVSYTVPANRASRRVMEKIGMRRDEASDFDHPLLAEDDPLRPHVFYRLSKTAWRGV